MIDREDPIFNAGHIEVLIELELHVLPKQGDIYLRYHFDSKPSFLLNLYISYKTNWAQNHQNYTWNLNMCT